MATPTYVIFFNDWPVYPSGINAGGGETATLALAKALSHRGNRVIACANLPGGDENWEGIEFWNFGNDYSVDLLNPRFETIGPFHCLAASLIQPFLSVRRVPNNLTRILINHAPSPIVSGFEPYTTVELMDLMLCVSNAQKQYVLSRGMDPRKVSLLKNGFDPEIFTYAGPEKRDFKSLLFIGRIEAPKGIHVLLGAYSQLIKQFPGVSLNVFGDMDYWPDMKAQKETMERDFAGLKFHGKAPQSVLSEYLKKSGILIFPSVSFESGSFAVIDAQASGCPAVAFSVGGVPEYIVDGKCGVLMTDHTEGALANTLSDLMAHPEKLIQMSKNGESFGRARTWSVVAAEVEKIAEKIVQDRNSAPKSVIEQLRNSKNESVEHILNLQTEITLGQHIEEDALRTALQSSPNDSTLLLIDGLRSETENPIKAMECFVRAAKTASSDDWQPFFKLTVLYAENGNIVGAVNSAKEVLARSPNIVFRTQLEKLIQQNQ